MSSKLYTVETIKYSPEREDDETAFTNGNEAWEFAHRMLTVFNCRVWLNGTELTRKDFQNR